LALENRADIARKINLLRRRRWQLAFIGLRGKDDRNRPKQENGGPRAQPKHFMSCRRSIAPPLINTPLQRGDQVIQKGEPLQRFLAGGNR